jgi:methionyl-tRNA formyltransferase
MGKVSDGIKTLPHLERERSEQSKDPLGASRRAFRRSRRGRSALTMLDLVFMGTPGFAVAILEALIGAGHTVRAVYSQPPRPAGRGHAPRPSPVQCLAEARGVPVRTPASLRDTATQAEFAALAADAAVVAAYGLILPPAMLAAPRLGCLNVHASLLPRWRGAAPVQRAILAGDAETGITIMRMTEGLDEGPILLQQALAIPPRAMAGSLTAALAALGGRLAVAALAGLAAGRLVPRLQPADGITYAKKLRREEGWLDWRLAADDLERRVRACDPWPGAWFKQRGERIRVLAAQVEPGSPPAVPGTVLDDRLAVACGSGVLRPTCLQRPGRAALAAAEFLRGFPIPQGTRLACPATAS